MSDVNSMVSSKPLNTNGFSVGPRPTPSFRAADSFVPSSQSNMPAPTPKPTPAAPAPAPTATPAPSQGASPQPDAPAPDPQAPNPTQPGNTATDVATRQKATQDDQNSAQAIYAQAQADREKTLSQIQQIGSDTRTAEIANILGATKNMITQLEGFEADFIKLLES